VSLHKLARQPYAVALGLCVGIHVIGVLVAPGLWLRLSDKESVFEHLGHAVLALACVVWVLVSVCARRGALVIAGLVTAYLLFCLLEEIDWGAVYGIDLGYSRIQRWTGGPNLHNARALEHTAFGWSLPWMSAPMLAYFASGFVPRARLGTLAAVLSTRVETFWFVLTVVVSAAFDGLHLLHWRLGYVPRAPAGGSLGDALGWFQIAFYLLWVLVGLRIRRELRATQPKPKS
jgi:hypothetical protein